MAANRTKTIEYALPMLSTAATYQAEGTTYLDSADTTIYIPETTSRAFVSVSLEVTVHDNHASVSADVSGWGVRGSCDAGTNWTTKTVSATQADSGENWSHKFIVDMTAEFVARFSGASDTFRWGFYVDYSATGPTLANASAKLVITYEYDDTAHATRIKTVRIPIESFNGRLSNSAQIVRQGSITGQIPALTGGSGLLPENSITIRQMFCELECQTIPSATTDAQLYLKIGSGGSETTYGLVENGNSSPINLKVLYDVTSIISDTTVSADLYARHNNSTESHFAMLGGWLTVTYEYNHTNSTTILNSLFMPINGSSGNTDISSRTQKLTFDFYVEEPATITLKQSALWITASVSTTSDTFTLKAGSQTATGYTPTSGATAACQFQCVHRIDSGGYRGAGMTLGRGKNTLTWEYYIGTADRVNAVSTFLILNYTSGKHASGDGVHNKSTFWLMWPNNQAVGGRNSAVSYTPSILESSFFVNNLGLQIFLEAVLGTLVSVSFRADMESGEFTGDGYIYAGTVCGGSSNEKLYMVSALNVADIFDRWASDPESRLDIETTFRVWQSFVVGGAQVGFGMWITYHSITFTASGTLSGYADADGAGLTVKLYRTDTGEYLGSATTTTGGAYSFTWYDDTITLFAEIREDSTHVGRSDNAAAS